MTRDDVASGATMTKGKRGTGMTRFQKMETSIPLDTMRWIVRMDETWASISAMRFDGIQFRAGRVHIGALMKDIPEKWRHDWIIDETAEPGKVLVTRADDYTDKGTVMSMEDVECVFLRGNA